MDALREFIKQANFPCLMAKSVLRKGLLSQHTLSRLDADVSETQHKLYDFIDAFRSQPERLSSFALIIEENIPWENFEAAFWDFMLRLREEDAKLYPHDPRVKSDPRSGEYGFSLKSEAFFILALHPESPRWARRFHTPAIIFNPHVQFVKMRAKGVFQKIRDLIRQRDFLLQGTVNPMLDDFGEKSEVFQYLGRVYGPEESIPLFQ